MMCQIVCPLDHSLGYSGYDNLQLKCEKFNISYNVILYIMCNSGVGDPEKEAYLVRNKNPTQKKTVLKEYPLHTILENIT